jgi:CRISPR-associated endonuclease/helicase Cas3
LINKGGPKIYHPLLGLPIIYEISKSLDNEIQQSLVVLAVASHHTALHQKLYSRVEENSCYLEVSNKQIFEDIVYRLAKRIGINAFEITECYTKDCKLVLDQSKFNLPVLSSVEDGIGLREYFVEIQGILNYSDWLASGQKEVSLNFKDNFLSEPYHYQIKAKNTTGNVFITLPTGSGKTETALLWLIGNLKSGFRTFYTLPTMTTINAMYQRLIDKTRYGLDRTVVSEYFSNVDLYLKLEGINPTKANLNLYRNFFLSLKCYYSRSANPSYDESWKIQSKIIYDEKCSDYL